jgi:hypothetical protein
MPIAARRYIDAVIALGAATLALSFSNGASSNPFHFILYFVVSVVASMLKFRLPGITGTYSPNFLFTLIGIAQFTLPETLVATCAGAVVQCTWNTKKRPTALQLVFNVASITVSTGLGFVLARGILGWGFEAYHPAVMALVATVQFVSNTALVSGVIALVEGRRFLQVCEQWYFWSFPYYLLGALLVGLLPLAGKPTAPEAWLLLIPVLYLIHFYASLSRDGVSRAAADDKGQSTTLPVQARLYISALVVTAILVMTYATLHWTSANFGRFLAYLTIAVLTGMCKLRLPRLRSSLSLGFVVTLVTVVELSFAEAVWLSAIVAIIQTVWAAQTRPKRCISPLMFLVWW